MKLRATNGERKVRIALHVRDLEERGRFRLGVSWEEDGGDFAFGCYVQVRHTDDGLATRYRRWKLANDVDPRWRCGTTEGTTAWLPARDRIVLTVPHRCLRYYDYYKVVNRWDFNARGSGIVDGRERVDSPTRDITLDRGYTATRGRAG